MAKLLFDSLRGVKLQKNFGQKFWPKKLYKMPKNWLRRCGVLKIDFSKVYRSISGFTGHPLKIKEIWWFIYPLSVGCKNPFVNISFRSQMAAVKLVGLPKKKVTLEKMQKFRNFFFADMVVSIFCNHPQSIWSIFIAPEA